MLFSSPSCPGFSRARAANDWASQSCPKLKECLNTSSADLPGKILWLSSWSKPQGPERGEKPGPSQGESARVRLTPSTVGSRLLCFLSMDHVLSVENIQSRSWALSPPQPHAEPICALLPPPGAQPCPGATAWDALFLTAELMLPLILHLLVPVPSTFWALSALPER